MRAGTNAAASLHAGPRRRRIRRARTSSSADSPTRGAIVGQHFSRQRRHHRRQAIAAPRPPRSRRSPPQPGRLFPPRGNSRSRPARAAPRTGIAGTPCVPAIPSSPDRSSRARRHKRKGCPQREADIVDQKLGRGIVGRVDHEIVARDNSAALEASRRPDRSRLSESGIDRSRSRAAAASTLSRPEVGLP